MTKETISEKQAHAMAQVCLDLHDALGCKWGDNPYLAIDRLKTAAQPAPVQPVGTYGEIFSAMWLLLRSGTQRDQQIYEEMKDKPLYTTPPAAPDLQAELDATNRQVEILSDALAESRREVAALKAVQEPHSWYSAEHDEWMTNKTRKEHERLNSYTHKVGGFDLPLYTTPLAARPAVPDAFGTREGEHPQYIQGWNDCRAEMLRGMKP